MNLLLGIMGRPFLLITLATFVLMAAVFQQKNFSALKIVAWFSMVFAILNLIFGSQVTGSLINRYGAEGTGIIISQEMTNNFYNEEPVERYKVLLKKADGTTVETSFESWDFNIYPAPDAYVYPEKGVKFSVKYLEKNPDRFIILSDPQNEYTRTMSCEALKEEMDTAKQKMNFAPEDTAFKNEYRASLQAYVESLCESDAESLEALRNVLELIGQQSSN